jgi:hypothetical protein
VQLLETLAFQSPDSLGWRRFGEILLLQHYDDFSLDKRQLLL